MDTVNCVACGKPAALFTGHVMHKGRSISAGWCSDECISVKDKKGYCGEWEPSMGITAEGKPATANVCHCGQSCPVWRSDRRFSSRI
jgi:hypothetical protein